MTISNPQDDLKVPDYACHSPEMISGFFGPYRWLSNFWPAEVEYKGYTFQSTEVAYQAAKCLYEEDMARFVGLDAIASKKFGKKLETYGIVINPHWDDIRIGVMGYLIMQKFSRHKLLRRQLLDQTDGKLLIEANVWKDKYWGIYYKFNETHQCWDDEGGDNNLGKLLMKVRRILK